MEVVKI